MRGGMGPYPWMMVGRLIMRSERVLMGWMLMLEYRRA